MQHQLPRPSTDAGTTYQLFELYIGSGKLRLGNVYCSPIKLNPASLPPPTDFRTLYMGDFNARHPELGDGAPTSNRNGRSFLHYIRSNHLTS